jgi:hypothetical protein
MNPPLPLDQKHFEAMYVRRVSFRTLPMALCSVRTSFYSVPKMAPLLILVSAFHHQTA